MIAEDDSMTDWEKRYREGEHANDEPDPLIVTFASKLVPVHALDIASGTGRHSIWLAERGWQVTAVDYSRTAMQILQQRARDKAVVINSCIADLERHEFVIERESYDLIVICNYLQRDLFPSIRAGTRVGGAVIAITAMLDDDPKIKPMNPAFLLSPGELRAEFEGWELIHSFEGKPAGNQRRRMTAEIVVRRIYDFSSKDSSEKGMVTPNRPHPRRHVPYRKRQDHKIAGEFSLERKPLLMLNRLEDIGRSEPTAPGRLMPPLRIRDFDFTSLSDAV